MMLLKKSFQPLETGLDRRRISNLETHSIRTRGNFQGFSTVSHGFDTLKLRFQSALFPGGQSTACNTSFAATHTRIRRRPLCLVIPSAWDLPSGRSTPG